MFKIDLTYTNFAGAETTETLRFNLTETELRDLIRKNKMFNADFLSYVSKEQNLMSMMDVIQELVIVSYGEISEDGRHFRKSEAMALDFVQSAAYEAFLNKLLDTEDGHEFMEFLMGIFPAKFAKEMQMKLKEGNAAPVLVSGLTS